MLISDFVESIRSDLNTLAEIAGPETVSLVERLGVALEPSIHKHLLDALNVVVQEFNVHDGAPLSLNIEGDAVRLTRLVPPGAEVKSPSTDYSARIALRLSDDLKENIENLASEVGSSVNSWIVHSLERTVQSDPSGFSVLKKRQLRGKGRA
ncbi:MAG: hypothetical protein ACYCPT_09360 [Acidimicrobiales bacterium]